MKLIYAIYSAKVIIAGILITENTVVKDTIFTESAVFCENFEENIVVMAAVGAETDIAVETSIVPLIPQR